MITVTLLESNDNLEARKKAREVLEAGGGELRSQDVLDELILIAREEGLPVQFVRPDSPFARVDNTLTLQDAYEARYDCAIPLMREKKE